MARMAMWPFFAEYDADVHVWFTVNEVLGIVTEADTLEQLAAKLEAMVPEMVEENGPHLTEEQRRGPHAFRLVAHYEVERQAAA